MKTRSTSLILQLLPLLGLLLAGSRASAWDVTNKTTFPLLVQIGNSNATNLGPGQTASWPFATSTNVVPVQFQSIPGDPREVSLTVGMEEGGSATVWEYKSPLLPEASGRQIYAEGTRIDGTVIQAEPRSFVREGDNVRPAGHRSVRFLASADCQFCSSDHCGEEDNDEENLYAGLTNAQMADRLVSEGELRGILYAGDLVQRANSLEYENAYLIAFQGLTRFLYDGCGNHDLVDNSGDPRDDITYEIATRKRTAIKIAEAAIHYSWDWHDVHFVQLNLMPANEPAPGHPDIDPNDALAFLQRDLSTNVGDSARPVVLIYHYGHDNFSYTGEPNDPPWWTADQRLQAWNTLASYNVALIINGHTHLLPHYYESGDDGESLRRYLRWRRPSGTSTGPDFIQTVIAGASEERSYIEVEINNANQVKVTLWNSRVSFLGTDPPVATNQRIWAFPFDSPIWVDDATGPHGYGWKSDPFPTVGEAYQALSGRFPGSTADETARFTMNIASGDYQENADWDSPLTLHAEGGPVSIGVHSP